MKIDVAKIEGYDAMTAEEKIAALEGYELEMPKDDSAEKLKSALNKASGEAAEYKRQLREKMSEAERAEAERAETEKAMKDKIAALEAKETINALTAKYLGLGYTPELASATANAYASGDMETVFANMKLHEDDLQAKVKSSFVSTQPNLSTGNPPSGSPEDAMVASFEKAALGL